MFRLWLICVGMAVLTSGLHGQDPGERPEGEGESVGVQQTVPDSVDVDRVSPGGAFLRSMLVPGWGQAAAGAYSRAGFYVLAQSGTAWMLTKTLSTRRSAQSSRDFWAREAEAELRAQGITDPDSLKILVEEDERVVAAQGLVDARSRQLEDWIALGIFVLVLGGADAFVSAHLADFPEPLTVETGPGAAPGQVEIGLSLSVGGPGG